jgi:hypothetical protein
MERRSEGVETKELKKRYRCQRANTRAAGGRALGAVLWCATSCFEAVPLSPPPRHTQRSGSEPRVTQEGGARGERVGLWWQGDVRARAPGRWSPSRAPPASGSHGTPDMSPKTLRRSASYGDTLLHTHTNRTLLRVHAARVTERRRVTLACESIESTSVVLPWSTCAMMAMLRMSERTTFVPIASARRPARSELGWPTAQA